MSDLLAIAREGAPVGARAAAVRASRSRRTSRARITCASPWRIARDHRGAGGGVRAPRDQHRRDPAGAGISARDAGRSSSASIRRRRPRSTGRCTRWPQFDFHGEPPVVLPVLVHRSPWERRMSYSAVFRCVAGCPGSYPLDTVIYRCPTCDGSARGRRTISRRLRDRSAAAWMRLFDERYKRTTWPYGSSVWGKKEWVCPEIRDDNVVSMDEGGTNLFLAEALRPGHRRRRGVGEVVRQLAHRIVQGSRDDRARVDGAADDGGRASRSAPSAARRPATRRPRSPPTRPPPAFRRSSCCRAAKSPSRSSCSRSRTARSCFALDTDFDGCMAIIQRLAQDEGALPRELDEQPAARGAEDGVD